MAGQIRMSPDELRNRAQTYGRKGNDVERILQELTSLQNQLASEWEGRAFEGFDNQFNELKPKVQNFAQLLHDIQVQLEKTAHALEEQDRLLSQNFGL